MHKFIIFLAIFSLFLFTGCSSFAPREYGQVTGVSIYLGYTKIAEKNDDDFKKAAGDLWMTIQSINTYGDLEKSVDDISAMFDVCINNKNLSEKERKLCIKLKKTVTDKVKKVIENKLERNANATEFLLGIREGIQAMINMGQ